MLIVTFFLFLSTLNSLALPVEKSKKSLNTDYLLPDNKIIPTNYDVTIDVSKSFDEINLRKFTGNVKITATVKEDVDKIVLHAADMKIEEGSIKIEVNGNSNSPKHELDSVRQFLEINFPVEKNSVIDIFIQYTGTLQDDMHGFYVSEYDGSIVLTTQFQPTHARKAFPCFDEPKYKATFDVTFKKPEGYGVLSNMPPSKDGDHINDLEVSFQKTPKMSTYLVAFIVHKFTSKPSPIDDKFKIWSQPKAISQTEEAANNVVEIVENLGNFTGINYLEHVPKMDMAALPDFSAGAMENWGLLTYRETALLVDPERSTNRDIQRVVSVIAHEVAHQWFGDLVTLTWWDNTWLNEGFARYFEYHTTGNIKPDWEMKDQFVVEQQQVVFGVDALAETTPLTRPVYTPTEISSHFGSISYNKGGSVIRMMEHFIGSDLFKEGLQHYLDKNQFKNTMPIDLWTAIEDTLSQSNSSLDSTIDKIMTSWISQPGYPVVNVKVNTDGTTTFSQQRFYLNPNENNRASDQFWFVPISYTTSKDMDFGNLKPKLWLTPHEPTKTVLLDSLDHIIVNLQQAGYYRVNYNEYMWMKIAVALKSEDRNKIHHLNKATLIDDSLNLARAGLLDYKIAFDISDYLENETGYYPWFSAFQGFRYLLQRYSENETTGKELRTYLKRLMEKLVSDKTFEENVNEKQISVFNRVSALEWACNLGHETCINQAKNLFKKHKTENTVIPKNLRSTVYCTALRNGDRSDWEFLWNKYLKSHVAAEKIGIISALGCSNDDAILKEYLLKSINDKNIRKQDAYYVFSSVYTGNMKGVDIAFQFLKDHHDDIKAKYNGMNDLEKAVLGLGSRLTDKEKIKQFEQHLDSNDDFADFREAAKETIKQNVAWAEKYSKNIGDILQKKRTGEPDSAVSIIVNKFVICLSLGLVSVYLSIFK